MRVRTRQHRQRKRRSARKQQHSISPSVTHKRGETSGMRSRRGCGQEKPTKARGWRDALAGSWDAAAPCRLPTGPSCLPTRGIG
ncbi:Hypothetical predicted protein [Pelobates cultripes]|uniref:Uncharacterized protein n=1 Tax=Pelobates cultripes TaxID=61616 RepID=A0AAD1SPI8_PELCU|nr:Hypothetical predicted protein [Pelobates cultripes]